MKNVAITVNEPVLEWARIESAKRNSSVSRLVGEMLSEKMRNEDAYARAMHEALKFEPIPFEGSYLTRNEAIGQVGP